MTTIYNDYPLVSILMTAYNREKYIAEAIGSVLESDYQNFELIIVDDKSIDNTVAIAKEYQKKSDKIKVFINDVNLGDYKNRNKAATYANGEYLMHVDSDDTIYRDAISNAIKSMQMYPEKSFGMCHLIEGIQPFYLNPQEAVVKHFFEKAFLYLGPGGTIIKREYFKFINHFPEEYGPANDMYFNLKAVCGDGIVMLPFKIIFYRRHDSQEINNRYVYLYQNYNYMKDALSKLPLPISDKQKTWLSLKNKRRFLINIAQYYFKTLDLQKTIQAIKKTNYGFKDALAGIFH